MNEAAHVIKPQFSIAPAEKSGIAMKSHLLMGNWKSYTWVQR